MFSISLKARALRSWQRAAEGGEKILSEREILALELIDGFSAYSPVTESVVGKVLGLSPSSTNELVNRLAKLAYIERAADGGSQSRGRPLQLTPEGNQLLDRIKTTGAARYAYLFADFASDEDWSQVERLLERVDRAATKAIRKFVFGQYEVDFMREPDDQPES